MKYPDNFINKVIQEDCKNILPLVPDNSIDLIILDPPYLTTEESWDKKEVVDTRLSKELFRIAKDSCTLYCWCGIGEKSQSLIRWFPIFSKDWHFKDLITWKKQRGCGMRKGWLYTREEIMWFVKNNKKFIWNKEEQYSDKKPTYRPTYAIKQNLYKSEFKRITNVWTDIMEKGMGTCCQESTRVSKEKKKGNIAIKPLKAIKRIIKLHTKENDIVLAPFAGSCTVGVGCRQLNRRYICIDINKEYCQIGKKQIDNAQKEG